MWASVWTVRNYGHWRWAEALRLERGLRRFQEAQLR